mmetsp:Transcript_36249/g.74471  ORF Transcript_36249/g.74471 Transcript_36249/m.74471 type:complete len:227 (-) Transcript_36249:280-960(-)
MAASMASPLGERRARSTLTSSSFAEASEEEQAAGMSSLHGSKPAISHWNLRPHPAPALLSLTTATSWSFPTAIAQSAAPARSCTVRVRGWKRTALSPCHADGSTSTAQYSGIELRQPLPHPSRSSTTAPRMRSSRRPSRRCADGEAVLQSPRLVKRSQMCASSESRKLLWATWLADDVWKSRFCTLRQSSCSRDSWRRSKCAALTSLSRQPLSSRAPLSNRFRKDA